jgi:hypothetical protein
VLILFFWSRNLRVHLVLAMWWRSCGSNTTLSAQVGVNTQPGEEPRWRHFSFFTVGVFTSQARAAACVAQRAQLAGRVSVWPLALNAPLRPCLGSDVLSAAATRQLVRVCMHAYAMQRHRALEGWVHFIQIHWSPGGPLHVLLDAWSPA